MGCSFGNFYAVLAEACAMSSVFVFSLSALSWFLHLRLSPPHTCTLSCLKWFLSFCIKKEQGKFMGN